ncbi:hypothetical protein CFB45_00570 [Burkholderia sp. HI2500]|nr:hypothetical protein CFB45_00570 [Burkholderia sp. HI2500]
MERRGRSAGYLSGAACGCRAACRCVAPPATGPGTPESSLAARPRPGVPPSAAPSATRFRPPRPARKVAHARQTGPLRENTDPPTTGNS